MGTETSTSRYIQKWKNHRFVKLNNPQMGTEIMFNFTP